MMIKDRGVIMEPTPENEKKLREAMLRLIDRRIREIFRLRFYCKIHDGCLLEHMEENEHE